MNLNNQQQTNEKKNVAANNKGNRQDKKKNSSPQTKNNSDLEIQNLISALDNESKEQIKLIIQSLNSPQKIQQLNLIINNKYLTEKLLNSNTIVEFEELARQHIDTVLKCNDEQKLRLTNKIIELTKEIKFLSKRFDMFTLCKVEKFIPNLEEQILTLTDEVFIKFISNMEKEQMIQFFERTLLKLFRKDQSKIENIENDCQRLFEDSEELQKKLNEFECELVVKDEQIKKMQEEIVQLKAVILDNLKKDQREYISRFTVQLEAEFSYLKYKQKDLRINKFKDIIDEYWTMLRKIGFEPFGMGELGNKLDEIEIEHSKLTEYIRGGSSILPGDTIEYDSYPF